MEATKYSVVPAVGGLSVKGDRSNVTSTCPETCVSSNAAPTLAHERNRIRIRVSSITATSRLSTCQSVMSCWDYNETCGVIYAAGV